VQGLPLGQLAEQLFTAPPSAAVFEYRVRLAEAE
jgi:hypothetical protein